MKTTLAHEPRRASRVWTLMLALCIALGSAILVAAVSASSAAALAATAPESKFSSAPGLPDGRVYEEVSPPDKNGFTAGGKTQFHNFIPFWSLASSDGNALLYYGNGPQGEDSHFGNDNEFVAQRTPGVGWRTRAAAPRPVQEQTSIFLLRAITYSLTWMYESEDFSHLAFATKAAWGPLPDETLVSAPGPYTYTNLFFTGSDPSVPATWIGRPTTEPVAKSLLEPIPLGGSSDLSTLYFASAEPVLPADAARAQLVAERAEHGGGFTPFTYPWGFYESHDGTISEAGVLPDGSLDPRGAAPAASAALSGHIPMINLVGNEVSGNGTRAFFVSPDPLASNPTEPQLYVRETAPDGSKKTVLVSRSQLPGHVGEKAPDGPAFGPITVGAPYGGEPPAYFYASADGTHAFFASRSQLTSDASDATVFDLGPLRAYAGGNYTLSVEVGGVKETTALVAESASAAEIQSALESLPVVGTGHASVSGEVVTFTGIAHASVTLNPQRFFINNQPEPNTYVLSVEIDGVSQSTGPLKLEGGSDAEVQAALEALSNVGAGNVTVENSVATFAASIISHKQIYLRSQGGAILGAPKTGPNEAPPKIYDFDTNTGTLSYLPGVVGELLGTASDGSWLLTENRTVSPSRLELWTRGPEGGTVTPIVDLPGGEAKPVQVAGQNSAFVFQSSAAITGFNNGGGGVKQVYRYDIATNELDCASCPPKGVAPTGGTLSTEEVGTVAYEANGATHLINETHDISSDGARVVFNTRDALVPQDTDNNEDAYEWENGNVFMITSGNSGQPSHLLDMSSSGGDVFFATAQGLVPGDTDGGFDAYDARVPQLGDNPPAAAVPCQGDVCQGPPSIASLLGPPASATFSGLGNPSPVAKPTTVKKKATPPKKKKKKKKKKKHGKSAAKTTKRGEQATRSISDSKAKG